MFVSSSRGHSVGNRCRYRFLCVSPFQPRLAFQWWEVVEGGGKEHEDERLRARKILKKTENSLWDSFIKFISSFESKAKMLHRSSDERHHNDIGFLHEWLRVRNNRWQRYSRDILEEMSRAERLPTVARTEPWTFLLFLIVSIFTPDEWSGVSDGWAWRFLLKV